MCWLNIVCRFARHLLNRFHLAAVVNVCNKYMNCVITDFHNQILRNLVWGLDPGTELNFSFVKGKI